MKSQSETNSEILQSAKSADVITPESSSTINVRHTRSVHPKNCMCLLHRELRFTNYSTRREQEVKTDLEWWQGD
jgi:hypothetical protein